MISIICEHCKEVQTNGVGRWIAEGGNTRFYCKNCEEKLLIAATKNVKPKSAPRRAKTNGSIEEAVVKN